SRARYAACQPSQLHRQEPGSSCAVQPGLRRLPLVALSGFWKITRRTANHLTTTRLTMDTYWRRACYWLLTLVWATQIYHFSTARYSADVSSSLLEQLLQRLLVTVSPSTISVLNLIARKLAHLIEYIVLTLLLYRSLAPERPLRWRPNVVFWSIGIASL